MSGLQEKIKTLHFAPSERQHVAVIEQSVCHGCLPKSCLMVCPTGVFVRTFRQEEDCISVLWHQCVECGACRLACPADNIAFDYPPGGYGVQYNQG